MGDRSTIEWTDATWNPIGGCTRVSEGCRNCYAEIMAARFSDPGQWGHGLAKRVKLPDGTTDHRWTGQMRFNESALTLPLAWKKPRRIFVNSTSDLFHEGVADDWLDRIFAVMALCPQHTFQILTKRPERARAYFRETTGWRARIANQLNDLKPSPLWNGNVHQGWQNLHGRPDGLPNVWLGTSVEDQTTADERIPHLLATPAAVRFISAEPLLGQLFIAWALSHPIEIAAGFLQRGRFSPGLETLRALDWVIVGGESGRGARPMHPDWARSLRDQCQAAGVPFFFKQWGEWSAVLDRDRDDPDWRGDYTTLRKAGRAIINLAGGMGFHGERVHVVQKVGKKAAGRLLDGREWNGFPNVS